MQIRPSRRKCLSPPIEDLSLLCALIACSLHRQEFKGSSLAVSPNALRGHIWSATSPMPPPPIASSPDTATLLSIASALSKTASNCSAFLTWNTTLNPNCCSGWTGVSCFLNYVTQVSISPSTCLTGDSTAQTLHRPFLHTSLSLLCQGHFPTQ